jgi:hypothetical protein
VVFQQWGKRNSGVSAKKGVVEQWCFSNGEKGEKLLNSGVSAMGEKAKKLLNSGVSAMGKKAKNC